MNTKTLLAAAAVLLAVAFAAAGRALRLSLALVALVPALRFAAVFVGAGSRRKSSMAWIVSSGALRFGQ